MSNEGILRAARADLKIASEGDTPDMQAMILAMILLGRTEGSCDHVAAYNLAVLAVVLFTRDGEPDVAAGYAAAGRWMIRHRWHKVMMGEDGNLRGFTDAEMDALVADTSTMNELAKLVRRIHIIRHMGS